MPRSKQTKYLLAQSLQELLATMPLEKISVNDIVEQAGVGRNTFYYHFEDKYDLVNWYFQSGVTEFLVNRSSYASWESLLFAVEEYFRENRQFYTRVLQYTGQNCLQEYMFEFFSAIFIQRTRESIPDLPESNLTPVGHFLSGAFLGLLLPWVKGGMKEKLPIDAPWIKLLSSGEFAQKLISTSPFA